MASKRRMISEGDGTAQFHRPANEAIAPTPREDVKIPFDPVNEAHVLRAMAWDPAHFKALIKRLVPDMFLAREHHDLFLAYREVDKAGIALAPEAVEKIAGPTCAMYMRELLDVGGVPLNIEWHVQALYLDFARATCARGPLPSLIEALRDPRTEADKVRALARAVASPFDGQNDRRHLREPASLIREQLALIQARASGLAYPFGIPGLDHFGPNDVDDSGRSLAGRKRVTMGAFPGGTTIVTALSGGGKSTFIANLIVAQYKLGRRVTMGCWEMPPGQMLELAACVSLAWSRTDAIEGTGWVQEPERMVQLEEEMHEISKLVRFMEIPFGRRAGEKRSNDRNLDIVQGYLADSACDVFIADLWKRALASAKPDEEEDALIRQQAMFAEERVHGILVQQQRGKDVEQRPDKRPTREGVKGSGAWTEVGDTMIGVHYPALFKKVDPLLIEVFILKQRYGRWPLGVEFDWDPEVGRLTGGRSIPYNQPGETDFDASLAGVLGQKPKARGGVRRGPW